MDEDGDDDRKKTLEERTRTVNGEGAVHGERNDTMTELHIEEHLEERSWAEEIPSRMGQRVRVSGWLHTLRRCGSVAFLTLRERTGLVQVVLHKSLLPEGLVPETVLTVEGLVTRQPGERPRHEIQGESLRVLSLPEEAPPIPVAMTPGTPEPGLAALLDHRALSLRTPERLAVFSILSEIYGEFAAALRRRGFTEIRSPKIVGAGAEGGSELFELDYFGRKAYLAQSPQFYKQICVGSGLERVFEIAPAFRAERHATARHLNEFVSMDVEMGFVEELEELLRLEEEILREIFARLRRNRRRELAMLGVEVPALSTVPRLTMAEAKERLATAGRASGEADLTSEEERALGEIVREETGSALVFVTAYPASVRPAYAMPMKGRPELTESFDLLLGGQEITTGGLRIHEAEMLEASLRRAGCAPESFAFYLEAFRHGMPPHGGFAIGAERLATSLLGLGNVRHASLFPRDRHRLSP